MPILTVRICPGCHHEFAVERESKRRYCSTKCMHNHSQRIRKAEERKAAPVRGDYSFSGYNIRYGTPVEDYLDFESITMPACEVREMLNRGHFPPGLILRTGPTRLEVMGRYFDRQKLAVVQ